jgi:non-ribosomal peptide synthetase component F
MIEHNNVTNFIFYFKENNSSSLFSKICFDIHIQDLFPTLLRGSTLFIIPEEIRKNMNDLFNFIEKNIEIVFLPSSILKLFPKKKF